MLKKFIITLAPFFSLLFCHYSFFAAAAEDITAVCAQLQEKASSDMVKYSLDDEINGPLFLSCIRCAFRHRNSEFCAIEMVSFDITG